MISFTPQLQYLVHDGPDRGPHAFAYARAAHTAVLDHVLGSAIGAPQRRTVAQRPATHSHTMSIRSTNCSSVYPMSNLGREQNVLAASALCDPGGSSNCTHAAQNHHVRWTLATLSVRIMHAWCPVLTCCMPTTTPFMIHSCRRDRMQHGLVS